MTDPRVLPVAAQARPRATIRVDLKAIAEMIEPGTRVLDIGCGDGALLDYLAHEKRVDARGIEISQAGVNACVAQGLSVVQGDADTDLKDYPTGGFDYAILSQTLQATSDPKAVVGELVRIARRAIVSFPNFGVWHVRLKLLLGGRMPVTDTLSAAWYETPNIHLCTIDDFVDLCGTLGVSIEKAMVLDSQGRPRSLAAPGRLANLLGEQGLFVLRRRG
ncbi:MAG: methionine biosynthesis protein MetW [Alphaproteobacteria bacterium]|nr:methionine biosynthesis protein MetW [Alphaproteobacteria bacterium]